VGKGRVRTNTNYESLLDFKFPEIRTSKVVTWQAHVDDKTTLDCEQICIRWTGIEIPLKTRTTLNYNEILHMLQHAENEPDILQEA
jgi:hypothetical protein